MEQPSVSVFESPTDFEVPAVERGFLINLRYDGDMQALANRARAAGAKVEGPVESTLEHT